MNKILLFMILSSILVLSCSENKSSEERKVQEPKSEKLLSDKPFVITDVWMRPGVENRNSAAFMKIINNTEFDDTLYSVSSDMAKVVELHETFSRENDLKGMRHVDYIIIPSKSIVELKPGNFHIMLIGLNKNMKIGDTALIKLKFKITGDVKLNIVVK